jgi:hypothetical protein
VPGWVATLIVGTVTTLSNALLLAYFFGKLSQRVDQHDKEFGEVDRRFDGNHEDQRLQWNEINSIGRSLERVKGSLGLNGGK